MKISIYIRNREDGASYYRIYQYISLLKEKNVNFLIREFTNSFIQKLIRKSDRIKAGRMIVGGVAYFLGTIYRIIQLLSDVLIFKPDVVFVQREIFPRYIPLLGRLLLKILVKRTKRIIWDFDDNICFTEEISKWESSLYEEHANNITVPNEYLRMKLHNKNYEKVILIPTTDNDVSDFNCKLYLNKRKNSYKDELRIIWVGTFYNLKYVKKIEKELDYAAKQIMEECGKKVILEIVCNNHVELNIKNILVQNTKWSRSCALDALKRAHIGIMPLEMNEVTLGKAGFKAVQYLGAGVPVILSAVGFNKEVIQHGKNGLFANNSKEWADSIKTLAMDESLYSEMSKSAREQWEDKFNSEDIFNKYFSIFSNDIK